MSSPLTGPRAYSIAHNPAGMLPSSSGNSPIRGAVTEQPFHTTVDRLRAATQERIENAIREAVPSVAPALAISVWSSGAPWYEAYCGWVDPESEARQVGFDSLFDLASVSKLFTATAFLRLANDFKVDVDDAVVSVIP